MDLRKYRKKSIDAAKVLPYEYSYYSYSGSEYGQPCLCIIIERNEETVSSPGYELMIKFDQSGIITEIMRLKKIFGAGSLIKKFPASVEERPRPYWMIFSFLHQPQIVTTYRSCMIYTG